MLTSTSRRDGLRIHTAVLLAAGMLMAAPAPPLAGQQEVVDTRLVIMNVRTTETGRQLNEQQVAMLEQARGSVCGLLAAAAGAIPQDMPGTETGGPLHTAMGDLCRPPPGEGISGEPTIETTDYTIYIQENRMSVHTEDFPVMVWRVIPGSGAQMYFYDPETGRIQNFGGEVPGNVLEELNLQDPEGRLNLQDADRATNVAIDYIPRGPSLLGAGGERLGYPVHRYELGHQMVPEWARNNAPFGTMRVYSDGGAWIAHDTPYNEVVGRFFENFATHVDSGTGGMLAGLTASMAQLGRLGVPMETVDTTSVRLTLTGAGSGFETETGVETFPDELILEQTIARTVVTDIRFGTYEIEDLEEIFGPEQDETLTQGAGGNDENPDDRPPPCDCTCEGFREFQDLDENDPNAMAKVMCAQQCVSRWISCGGPGCSGS